MAGFLRRDGRFGQTRESPFKRVPDPFDRPVGPLLDRVLEPGTKRPAGQEPKQRGSEEGEEEREAPAVHGQIPICSTT